jgi:hypothetical protein
MKTVILSAADPMGSAKSKNPQYLLSFPFNIGVAKS